MQVSMQSFGISKHEASDMHSTNPFLQLPLFKPLHYIISAFFLSGDRPSAPLALLFVECVEKMAWISGFNKIIFQTHRKKRDRGKTWDFFFFLRR